MAKDNAQQIETKIKTLYQNPSFKERVLRFRNEDESRSEAIAVRRFDWSDGFALILKFKSRERYIE
jgi:hypothetical protein